MVNTGGAPHVERLPPEAASAGRARRIVGTLLADAGLDDLAEVAVLLVSETVTNAVLHAATEVELECTVQDGSVTIRVGDGSTVLPGVRRYDDEATTGRGIGLVELLATTWGVEPHRNGKRVWFTVGGAGGSEGDGPAEPLLDTFVVRFERLPVRLVRAALQYGDAVLRELALASLEGDAHGGAALPPWRGTSIDLAPVLEPVDRAVQDGVAALDVDVVFPCGAGEGALARLDLVELADRMASEGRLLSPPALPEISACRHWLLGQISDQARGAPPVPWRLPEDDTSTLVALTPGERAALAARPGPQVVSDEANRIVFVDQDAADLLGWDVDDLVGRRVTTIVPPALHEAHLAGFARYQITRSPVILDRVIRVAARRRDGSEVPVDLTIELHRGEHGHRGFRALLQPVRPPR